jgi:predicted amidohydrolase
MQLTIALSQLRITPLQPLKNLARIASWTARAKRNGADLVVFPEDAICGPLEGQTAFVQYAPEYLARMQELAAKYAIDLVPGSWTVEEGGFLYNQTCYIGSNGDVKGIYRKVNLWETERASITPGLTVSVFPTRFGHVGLIICWDISFPAMFAAMNAQGAELVISPTYWSFPRKSLCSSALIDDEVLLIDSLCTTRAFENNILFAYCNAAGSLEHNGTVSVLSGRSQVTHPLQKVLVKARGNGEQLLLTKACLQRGVEVLDPLRVAGLPQ